MRAKCHFEDIDKGQRQAIIVDELPYQVNKKTLQERMAELVNEKKIEGISHIQDESDKSGMRLVIELKRGEVPEVVLNNLYKQTQLQDTFGINMVALIDGQPRLCNLKDLIQVFLQHRREVVTRRTVFDLRKARERGHVLEGLAVALANIDDFIAIIRNAPTPPVAKAELMSRSWDSKLVREMLTRTRADGGVINADDYRPDGLEREFGMGSDGLYRLSDTQAQEILQMRLQRLTGLEQDKIVAEYKEVMAEIDDLLDILAKPARVSTIISDELTALQAGVRPDQAGRPPQPGRAQRPGPRDRRPDHAHRHGGDAVAHRATSRASRCPNTARKSAAAAASRPRRPRKTTGSTSSSSPTRTTTSCASPTAAGCTGSRSGKCRRARAARAAGRSSTCSRCRKARRSTWCCR